HGTVATSSETSVGTQPGGSVTSRTASETPQVQPSTSHHHTGAKFRHGLLQLMIHTIDPMHDGQYAGKVDEKATQLHAIASLKVLLDATKPQNGATTTSAANHVNLATKQETMLVPSSGVADMPNGVANVLTDINLDADDEYRPQWKAASISNNHEGNKETHIKKVKIKESALILLNEEKCVANPSEEMQQTRCKYLKKK
uniref:Sodium/potassium/calcium exchanger Nckx30C-like n=1 Tax=Diabrotica virgifera virgifera TaxID=50390 RepID=A0A6P7GHP9_DIAVI